MRQLHINDCQPGQRVRLGIENDLLMVCIECDEEGEETRRFLVHLAVGVVVNTPEDGLVIGTDGPLLQTRDVIIKPDGVVTFSPPFDLGV